MASPAKLKKKCRYSSRAKIVLKSLRDKERTGVVTGESEDKEYWHVLWDGNRQRVNVHKKLITLIDENGNKILAGEQSSTQN